MGGGGSGSDGGGKFAKVGIGKGSNSDDAGKGSDDGGGGVGNKDLRHAHRGDRFAAGMEGRLGGEGSSEGKTRLGWF